MVRVSRRQAAVLSMRSFSMHVPTQLVGTTSDAKASGNTPKEEQRTALMETGDGIHPFATDGKLEKSDAARMRSTLTAPAFAESRSRNNLWAVWRRASENPPARKNVISLSKLIWKDGTPLCQIFMQDINIVYLLTDGGNRSRLGSSNPQIRPSRRGETNHTCFLPSWPLFPQHVQ